MAVSRYVSSAFALGALLVFSACDSGPPGYAGDDDANYGSAGYNGTGGYGAGGAVAGAGGGTGGTSAAGNGQPGGDTLGGTGGAAAAGTGGMFGGSGGMDTGAGGMQIGDPAVGGGSERGPAPTDTSIRTSGPYSVDSYTSGYRDGPQFADATVWYPTGAPEPLALVAVVPGFVSPQSSIMNWGPFLASHGIATITIGTNTGNDQPDMRARALVDSLVTLEEENNRAGSPLQGKLDPSKKAVMGWSMGGGGTLIALKSNPELKAGIGLAAWSSDKAFSTITQPTLLFAGTADGLAGGQSQGFYSSIPASVPKMLFEVQGAPHEVANSPDRYNGEIGAYGLSWMKLFLEDDERYRQFLLKMPDVGLADFERNGI